MLRPQLLALAASSASAFLVVPDVMPSSASDNAEEGAFKALPIEEINPLAIPPSVQQQSISVACAECPGEDAKVHFDIEVVDKTRLLVNGFEVYPADDPPAGDLTARVSSYEGSEGAHEALGWAVWWQVEDVDKKQDMRILDWHLGVGSIGSINVNDVGFGMTLIIGPNNEVMIADVKKPVQQIVVEPECEGLLCRFEELWGDIWSGMGCHRTQEEEVTILPAFDGPQGKFPGDEGTETRRFGEMVLNVVSHIFLPVIMGILAGVGSAVLVMLVCSIIATVGSKLAGREDRDTWTFLPPRVLVIETEEEDEKDGLMEGQAPPPAYEGSVEKE